jgi:general secretion pathway protein H
MAKTRTLPCAEPALVRLGRENGFTLIELVVAIALLALIAAIAVPAVGRVVDLASPKNGAEALAEALRDARSSAIAERRLRRFSFHLETRTWQHGNRQGSIDGKGALDFDGPLQDAAPDRAIIVFFPDGSSTGGTFRFGDGATALSVNWLNGHISRHDP